MPIRVAKPINNPAVLEHKNSSRNAAVSALRGATTKEQVHNIVVSYVKTFALRPTDTLKRVSGVVELIFELKNNPKAWHPLKGSIMAKGFASAQVQLAEELTQGGRNNAMPVGTHTESDTDSDAASYRSVAPQRFTRTRSVLGFFSPNHSGNNTPYQSDSDAAPSPSPLKRARGSALNFLSPSASARSSSVYSERDSFETVCHASINTVRESAETVRPALGRSHSVVALFTRPVNALTRRASSANLLGSLKRSQTPLPEELFD